MRAQLPPHKYNNYTSILDKVNNKFTYSQHSLKKKITVKKMKKGQKIYEFETTDNSTGYIDVKIVCVVFEQKMKKKATLK